MSTDQATSQNVEDRCRDAILRTLNSHRKNARGVRATAMKIRKLQQALRPEGFKQQDVARNLTYLVEKGWVTEVSRSRQVRLKSGMTIDNEDITYRISDVGVDKLEGASVFQHNPAKFAGINISNVGGVITIGDGNIVNAKYSDTARALEQLISVVENSPQLSDSDKLDIAADLTALRAQLAKPNPQPTVVQALWAGAEKLSTIGGVATLLQFVRHGLQAAGFPIP